MDSFIPFMFVFIGFFFLYQGIAKKSGLIFSRQFSMILGVFWLTAGIFISME